MPEALRNSENQVAVTQLGYLGVGVSDMAAWKDFAANAVGLEISEEAEDGTVYLRLDSYHHRFVLTPTGEDDAVFVGWEVKDANALEQMAAQIRAYGLEVTEGTQEEAEARKVLGLIKFNDPDGLPVEVYYGAYLPQKPFNSPQGIRAFNAETLGMGHIFLNVTDPEEYSRFYLEVLGAKRSDFIYLTFGPKKIKAHFLHVNPRHHSMALAPRPPAMPGAKTRRLGHVMLEVKDIDDMGLALDRFLSKEIQTGNIGRHTNDKMVSWYGVTPSGFQMEFGFGARTIDDESKWEVQYYNEARIWGVHDPRRAAQQPAPQAKEETKERAPA